MLPMTATLDRPLKGSRALVLQALQQYAIGNRCVCSYEELAEITGYCAETVRMTIKSLCQECFISVEKHLGERRNTYRILQRREG